MFYSAKEGGFFVTKETQDCVEISNEDHAKLMLEHSQGKEIVSDKKGYPILKEPDSPSLETVKSNLKSVIDSDAEKERKKYITDGTGQSLVYKEKQDEAFAYSKNWFAHKNAPDEVPEPKENDYPMLKAGIGVEGKTMIDVAAIVTQAYADWQIIGAAIEGVRLKAKMAIAEAKTADEAQAIFEAIEWPKIEKQDNAAPTT